MNASRQNSTAQIALLLDGMIRKNAYLPFRIGGAMRVEDHPDYAVINSGLATDTFNLVISKVTGRPLPDAIARVADEFNAAKLPAAWWACSEQSDPALAQTLGALGFHEDETSVGMTAQLDSLPEVDVPRGFNAYQISSRDEVATFGRLIGALFDPPDAFVEGFYQQVAALDLRETEPLKLFVGEVDGQVVSTASLFVEGHTAHVFDISTAAQSRHRGFASAIAHFALTHARDQLGARQAALQASPDGLNVYRRLGFEQVCVFQVYSNRRSLLEDDHE